MTVKKSIIAISLCCLSTIAFAETANTPPENANVAESVVTVELATVEGAQVFSKFDDKYPAMVNYFTKNSFAQIQEFYQNQYGAPVSEQTQYGRLELKYQHMNHNIRVIVAKQNNHREVDVIVEQEKAEEANTVAEQ
ncbi:hypothetical protein [Thalassotalea crassostreae]|uniref:hypothetical protein n=1 Tax=Thalassotalea crassostreae TaxID=1763536 RepID=UPI0008385252|nr:hypothetical protein [Thalassotalea crassostreae]